MDNGWDNNAGAINNHMTHWYILCLSITTNPTRIEFECLDRWDRRRVSRSGCGKGGAILRPVSRQPPIDSPPPGATARRRFNSRTKKASGGRSQPCNSCDYIGLKFCITHNSTARSANRKSRGGSWYQFQFRGQRGVVDSGLRADSAVPLARAVVVLILAGPCHQGTLGDPTVTRTNPAGRGAGCFRWRDDGRGSVANACGSVIRSQACFFRTALRIPCHRGPWDLYSDTRLGTVKNFWQSIVINKDHPALINDLGKWTNYLRKC